MKENFTAIEQALSEENLVATDSAKQALADFTVLYARKLLRECLKPNRTNVSLSDLR